MPSTTGPVYSHRLDAVCQRSARLRDRIGPVLADRVGIDIRALAALRIALGTLVLVDLALRARSLRAFYTDAGVFPRSALADIYPTLSQFSLHTLSGALWWQALLFLVAATIAIALVLGYRTRFATLLSLVLLVSLHIRNPVVLNAGDVVFRRLLLWSCFLPLGRRWSLDARRKQDADTGKAAPDCPDSRVVTLASAALLLQVATIYTTNVLFKVRSEVWLSGTAVERALAMGKFSTPLADLLVDVPLVLELLNWGWLGLLASAPLLVLATGRLRTLHVALFVSVHVGMLATMAIGIFPLVLLAGMLPFLPTTLWEAVEARLPALPSRMNPRQTRSATDGGQSPSGPLCSARRSVARITPVVVVLLVAIAATWNLAALGVVALDTPGESTLSPSTQRWDMFAGPGTMDLQMHPTATLDSGERVDALESASFAPNGVVDSFTGYPSARWRKYLVSLRYDDPPGLEEDLATGLCRAVEANTGRSVESVSITAEHQPTRVSDRQTGALHDLGTYECG